MKLYKMELYKICHRKAFVIGSAAAVLILIFFFWGVEVGEEISTVDGRSYQGYAAVQKNREITREYEGILTDEKVEDIAAVFGFPQKVEENYGSFRDANYLNNFVLQYLSDGYFADWDNYKIASNTRPIAETELGALEEITGRPVELFYTTGWNAFLEFFQMGMVLGSILIIFGTAIVFSEEKQTKMLPLIFTTKEGREKDISAKIAASFTLTAMVYGGVAVMAFLMCSLVYGFDGAQCPVGLVRFNGSLNRSIAYMPVRRFTVIILLMSLLAVLTLCAVTLCISAHCGNSFHALAVSAVCWGAPVLLRIFFSGFPFLLVSGTPVFLILTDNFWDIYSIWFIPVAFAVILLAACGLNGYSAYKRTEVL